MPCLKYVHIKYFVTVCGVTLNLIHCQTENRSWLISHCNVQLYVDRPKSPVCGHVLCRMNLWKMEIAINYNKVASRVQLVVNRCVKCYCSTSALCMSIWLSFGNLMQSKHFISIFVISLCSHCMLCGIDGPEFIF